LGDEENYTPNCHLKWVKTWQTGDLIKSKAFKSYQFEEVSLRLKMPYRERSSGTGLKIFFEMESHMLVIKSYRGNNSYWKPVFGRQYKPLRMSD
jgi:hypothetical protein